MKAEPSFLRAHRKDIDGLRAVAVLSVVAFHLHFAPASGGYVGVDVFFVISGYLITGILVRELARGSFSLAGFYERRARRILPALFAVLLFTSILSYVYLLPGEFQEFARSLLAAVFSISNIFFWTRAGYFSGGGPLLHTWSLAVEEQFYLFFPLLLMFLFRKKKVWLSPSVALVAFASFVISVIVERRFPSTNFYMPYTRTWELLVGGILALGFLPPIRYRLVREVVSVVGAALIVGSVHIYTDQTVFPGLNALPPCMGAACIIFAGEAGKSLVGSLLSSQPFVFLGAISYSLYLWHWPILEFNERGFLYFGGLSHRGNVLVYLLACVALAWLSWQFIENPLRAKKVLEGRKPVFLAAFIGIAGFSSIALSILSLHGLRYRYPPAALKIVDTYASSETQEAHFRLHECFLAPPDTFATFAKNSCLHRDVGGSNILLLGDSHAAALWNALNSQLPGTHVLQATASNCKPFPGQDLSSVCGALMDYIYGEFLNKNRIDAVVVTARWKDRDMPEIFSVVQACRAKGIAVVVIGPSEEYDTALPILLAYAEKDHDLGLPDRHRVTQIEALDRRMSVEAKTTWNAPYVSLISVLCSAKGCLQYADAGRTVPILFDHDHYTQAGSHFAMQQLDAAGALHPLENLSSTVRQ